MSFITFYLLLNNHRNLNRTKMQKKFVRFNVPEMFLHSIKAKSCLLILLLLHQFIESNSKCNQFYVYNKSRNISREIKSLKKT